MIVVTRRRFVAGAVAALGALAAPRPGVAQSASAGPPDPQLLEDLGRLRNQPHGRFTQTNAENVLAWRYAREALEGAEKVVWAKTCFFGQRSEC